MSKKSLRVEAESLLNDKTMDPDVRNNRLKSLKAEFDYYEIARNNWLSDFQDTFSVETKEVRENYLQKSSYRVRFKKEVKILKQKLNKRLQIFIP